MRLALSILALVINGLGILVMLALIAFSHMIMPGVVVAVVFIAVGALNVLAIVFGAHFFQRAPSDLQATARTFD